MTHKSARDKDTAEQDESIVYLIVTVLGRASSRHLLPTINLLVW